MTFPDAMKLLLEKIEEHGQAKVARMMEVSPTAISNIKAGKYGAAPDEMLRRVIEVFGGLSVECPCLGEIPLSRCAQERKKPFQVVNHQAITLWKACQKCERRN